ncbi:MAG: cbb3-type cytochrome c oxidase subunit I [Acidimicrobiales bacterium]
MTATVEPVAVPDAASPSLDAVWEDRPGIPGFLTTVDHKRIAVRYLVTATAFLFIGGLEAMVLRAQLAGPNGTVVDADTYNRIMTMHGTTMIFLFNTPVFAGFGNYLVPLLIGAREMAFPRVNAFSYWVYLGSGSLLYSSFLLHAVPDGGWFAYTPLTSSAYSPDVGLDLWAMGIVFLGISTTAGGINFIVTIFRMRPRHDPQPPPAVLLGDPHHVVHDRVRPAGDHPGRGAAGARPDLRHAVLLAGRRRGSPALPAPVLDLGPPGGLHPVHPRHRDHLDGGGHLQRPAGGGLPPGGGRAGGHRLHQLRAVDAPHVRHRRALPWWPASSPRPASWWPSRAASRSSPGWPPCSPGASASRCRCSSPSASWSRS